MAVAGITRFLYTPDDQYMLQLILGTNGSGKSSLMHVLWGLPANVDDFDSGGRFEIDIDFKGHQYQVMSNFEGPKPHHHFLQDGVELNEDGKITGCYALCEEHLGVTNEIRSLALGKELLTNMGPARRRYWLVKLADTDFTYAMGVYKKLTEAHRDAQGAIKRLGKRLVDERAKLTPLDVVEKINNEYRDVKELISDIYGMRNAEVPKSKDVLMRLNDQEQNIDQYCREVDRLSLDAIEASGFKSREDLEIAHGVTKIEIASTQHHLQHCYTEHTRIKRKYDLLVKAGTESVTQLNERKEDALTKIALEEVYICYPGIKPSMEVTYLHAEKVFKEIYFQLYEAMTSLKSNDGEYSSEKAEMAEGRVDYDRRQLNALEARISRLKADIDHKRHHVQQAETVCPNCRHSWSSKASESDLVKAEAVLKELEDDAEKMKVRVDENSRYLKEFNEYRMAYKNVVMMFKEANVCMPWFNLLIKDNRMMKNPGAVADELIVIQKDLFHHAEIERLRDIIQAADEQIELKKNLESDTLEFLEAELNRLEEQTGTMTGKLTRLSGDLKAIEKLMDQDTTISRLNQNLLSARNDQAASVKEYVRSRYQEMLMEVIISLQTQLARKEDVLLQITSQQAIVGEIEYQLNEAMMNERIAKAAHQALSPTTGAIAEGLHRFINVFVGKLNRTINSIWVYPLKIQSVAMEEGQTDLDYKFPFIAADNPKPKKDVVEGSESMLDVFNFAFSFCALQQLGLGYLPLFLDEFEAAFDDAHRERAIYFIKKLLDENVCGQIFAISHYESNHGALRSLAQTCVLSRDNLMLSSDGVYNEHVVIN